MSVVSTKWKPNLAVSRAEKAMELAKKSKAALQTRLPAGLLDGMPKDIAQVRGLIDSAQVFRTKRKSFTASQNELAKRTADLVALIRGAITSAHGNNSTLQKAFGVGENIHRGKVSTVTAAADKALKAAIRFTEKIRAAGLIQSDFEELQQLTDALAKADSQQEASKMSAQQATAARTNAQLRLEAAVEAIGWGGQLHFRADPIKAKAYADLVRPVRSAKKKPAKKAPTTA